VRGRGDEEINKKYEDLAPQYIWYTYIKDTLSEAGLVINENLIFWENDFCPGSRPLGQSTVFQNTEVAY
jgi:hypothetical protein